MGGVTTSKKATRREIALRIREAVRKYHPDLEGDYDPLIELALVGANRKVSADLRVAANKEVAGYLYHKLKAVDLTVAQKGPVTVQVIDFTKIGQDTNPMTLIEGQHQIVKELTGDDDEDLEHEGDG